MFTNCYNKATILLYHQVGKSPVKQTNLDCYCLISEFEKQMKYLADSEFEVISLNKLLNLIKSKLDFKKNYVVLTFDDGCNQFSETAMPVLEKFGFPATIFPVSGNMGDIARWPKYTNPDLVIVSESELKFISDKGIDIGAHSINHSKLSELSYEEALNEIVGSKKKIEEIIGKKVISFSFPHGNYNENSIQIIQKAGFKCAVTCESKSIKKQNNLFSLPRKYVTFYDKIESFKQKLMNA